MTPLSLREYAGRQRGRYRQLARRADKRELLDEFVAVTKLHRKAVIRLLRRAPCLGAGYPRGGSLLTITRKRGICDRPALSDCEGR